MSGGYRGRGSRFDGIVARVVARLVATCMLCGLGWAGCGRSAGSTQAPRPSARAARSITIKGSDTLVILAQRWAEAYMKQRPDVEIDVSGGGTGTGLAALINGTASIATASRAIKPSERSSIEALGRGAVTEHAVALDAIVMYVHPSNPVKSLTLPELKRIFRGHARYWTDVGGAAKRFVLYSRENNSGTYAFFKEHVLLSEDFAAEAQTLPGTAAVIYAVGQDPYSIGYGGVGYAQSARMVPIETETGEVVMPTLSHAQTGRYPLARKLFMYHVESAPPEVRAFIDWVRSEQGQKLVADMGFFPLVREAR
jgi:phosphate transport system substrate-binding protein